MITIKPFRAIRPTRDKAYLVATRSYVSYDDDELADVDLDVLREMIISSLAVMDEKYPR